MKKLLFLPIALLFFSCAEEKVDENLTMPDKLIGVELTYKYSKGNEYVNSYTEEGIVYQFKSGKFPDKWIGPIEYNHMMTEGNEHLISWFEPDRGDYVTLLINFEKKTVYGSAIVGLKKVHFQKAEISDFKVN